MKREAGERAKGKGERKEPPALPLSPLPFPRHPSGGWTLIELVITMTVLTVLTLAVIPIVRTSVRRQKEQRLHEALREMRNAIDEFKRDTVGMQCGPGGPVIGGDGGGITANGGGGGGGGNGTGVYMDPRSRVVVSDCKIFGVDNPEHYPPDLQTLVDGVDVVPRASVTSVPNMNVQPTENGNALIPKKKHYLREIPVDPITGKAEWCVLSSYDSPDEGCSSSPANVFDVRSKANGESLNGEKYSDW
jgi:general secretion pathway protein G